MFIRIAAATALVSLVALPAFAQQTVSEADAQQAAAQISQAFSDAYNAAKPADIAALFTSNGVYLTPGGTMLTDHQEMTKALTGRQKAGWTKERIEVIDAHPEGNDVLAVVKYEIQGTGASAGKEIGGYAALLLTREGANWRYKMLAANLKPVPKDITGMAAPTAQ
ncbi:MAG TPA: nuclear transport factor 2 family protein [Acidocella sp.]|jgi:ketosteroid isomerase-like protein|nr:nuclear transport factor 2 family protein [Acidocella sp.]